LAKVCTLEGATFACVKYVTDGADHAAGDDWQANLHRAAEKFNECYRALTEKRDEERLTGKASPSPSPVPSDVELLGPRTPSIRSPQSGSRHAPRTAVSQAALSSSAAIPSWLERANGADAGLRRGNLRRFGPLARQEDDHHRGGLR